MPFLALTAPAPGAVDEGDDDETDGDGELLLAAPLGRVASAPSRTSTWLAASVELAVAVTLNSDAILAALPDAPGPYCTSVVVSGLVFATLPAVYPSFTSAAETWPARPGVLPPL